MWFLLSIVYAFQLECHNYEITVQLKNRIFKNFIFLYEIDDKIQSLKHGKQTEIGRHMLWH